MLKFFSQKKFNSKFQNTIIQYLQIQFKDQFIKKKQNLKILALNLTSIYLSRNLLLKIKIWAQQIVIQKVNIINSFLNNFIDEIQKEEKFNESYEENLPFIFQTIEMTLQKFQPDKLNKVSLSFRNNLMYNLYKICGELSNRKIEINFSSDIISFIYNELQLYQNIEQISYIKIQNLKTLLNIGVNMNSFLSQLEWEICLKAYIIHGAQENKMKSHELDEFFIISNSFVGLFYSSSNFKLRVLNNIIQATKELVLKNSLQNQQNYQILLEYICLLIQKNLHRIELLWKSIHDLFLNLLEKSKSYALKFAMNFLTKLTDLFLKQILDLKNGKEVTKEKQNQQQLIEVNKEQKVDETNKTNFQDSYDQCFLLINILLNKKSSDIYFELFNLIESLIDQNGYELRPQDWHSFLQIIKQILIFHENQKLSEDFSKKIFELLQKLNANYLNSFNEKCLMDFIRILKNFIQVTNSKNYKYGVIEYFYTISDYINKNYNQDEELWLELFSFLNSNSQEKDPEIRNTSLNIFAGIVNNYGQYFTENTWDKAMLEIYLKSFDNILEIYFNLMREEIRVKNFPDTPSHILELKDQFENEKKQSQNHKMISHEDIHSLSKQWQETIKILIQSFNRIFTKYLQFPNKKKLILEKMFEKSFYLFRITGKQIFNEVTLVIKNIINSDEVDIKKKTTLLKEIDNWLSRNSNQGQAVHELMSILNNIFENELLINTKPNFSIILSIYSKIVFFSSYCEEYSTYFYNLDNMCKLFLTKIFTFVYLSEKQDDEICAQFIEFLPDLLKNKIANEKSNSVAINFIGIVCDQMHGKIENIPIEQFKTLLNVLFSVKEKIYDEEYCKIILKTQETIYFGLYKKIIPILKKNIEIGGEYLKLVLHLALENFFLLSVQNKERNEQIQDFLIEENYLCQKIVNFYMKEKLEKFEEFNETTNLFFEFLKKYKQNFDMINSNKKFDPIKESEEMTFQTIIQNFQAFLAIQDPQLQVQIIEYLQINFKSCVKIISSLSVDSPRSFKELKKIFMIFIEFECSDNLIKLLIESNQINSKIQPNKNIHLLQNYGDVAQLISIETDYQTKAYMIEFFNQVQHSFLS